MEQDVPMDNINRSLIGKVKKLLNYYRSEGLMTHAYASWGYLNRNSRVQKVELLPDNRDIFDLASLTKALVTTPLIYGEVQASQISLATHVGEWMGDRYPLRLDGIYRGMSLGDLLAHQASLPAWINFWINIWNLHGQKTHQKEIPGLTPIELHLSVLNRTARFGAVKRDIEKEIYSDVGFILLGLLIAIKKKKGLHVLLSDLLNNYMEGNRLERDLLFSPPVLVKNRCIPTSYCSLRKRLLVGEVHDENCAALGGESGHAGLFGTGDALTRFLINFCTSELGKNLIIENYTRAKLRRDDKETKTPLVGWRYDDGSFFKRTIAIGHLGFTGVGYWVLPEKNFFAVLLTNRVVSKRINPKIKSLRESFCNTIENSL